MSLDVLDLRPLSRGSDRTLCEILIVDEVEGPPGQIP